MSTTTDPTPYTQPQACLYLLPTYHHQQVPSCERPNAHVHAHTRAHVFPYVPGHRPVPTCTRFWVACAGTQKHSLLDNSPILDPFGALGSNQPSPSQAPLAFAWCCAYLQMDSGAAGAFGIGSNRNRGSSRWWWQPQRQRGLQQRRCLLWSWDFRQKTGPLTFQHSEGSPHCAGANSWPAGSHSMLKLGDPCEINSAHLVSKV